ncbi:MAG: MauE/DoxX family redox-associated membrane protein [Actinomycetota bacterium]
MTGVGRLRAASPYLLAGLLAGAGAAHFVATDSFVRIIPSAFPQSTQRPLVQLSGVAELACATLIALPRTRRFGAVAAAILLVAVFPANVKMATDGGIPGAGFPMGSPVVAWLRLPVQLPLIAWALSVARGRPVGPRTDRRIV